MRFYRKLRDLVDCRRENERLLFYVSSATYIAVVATVCFFLETTAMFAMMFCAIGHCALLNIVAAVDTAKYKRERKELEMKLKEKLLLSHTVHNIEQTVLFSHDKNLHKNVSRVEITIHEGAERIEESLFIGEVKLGPQVPQPPKSLECIAALLLPRDKRDNVLGDMEEDFAAFHNKYGMWGARFCYTKDLLSLTYPAFKNLMKWGTLFKAVHKLLS